MGENLLRRSESRETNNDKFRLKITEFFNKISLSKINEETIDTFYQDLLKNHDNKEHLIEFLKLFNFFLLNKSYEFNKLNVELINKIKEKNESIFNQILNKDLSREDLRFILEFSNPEFIDYFENFLSEIARRFLDKEPTKEDIKLIIRNIKSSDLIKSALEKLFNLKEDLSIQDYAFIIINVRYLDENLEFFLESKLDYFISIINRGNFNFRSIVLFIKILSEDFYQPYNSEKRKQFYKRLITNFFNKIDIKFIKQIWNDQSLKSLIKFLSGNLINVLERRIKNDKKE